ncbi:CpaF family protein [Lachnospira eligens]|uniref:Pilus assembly protein CpaF n=1 Tax=Lachnospira eligens (strain ATCC 27750 / DSM 3376 / VPI C15-48 / C15-B4) TaxID=515620 RepID=C4Z4T0_LACE2|nr:CpaF family protein [Lachnospira eligens]ACR72969.1 pilus assembly protein CpaF [[Eubacterium] eligens ATCC 27750]UEA98012.1 CpaF family protein [Lachnospira eligens]
MEGLYQTIRHKVYQNLDVGHDITDDELYQVIDRCIYEESREKIISIRQKEELRSRLYNSIKKLDILQELLDDDEITEIMVNGTECIFYEKQGRIKKWDRQFESEEKLADIAQRIAAMSNRMVNEASPIVDTRLNDGSRVNIVLPPVAIDGPVITIRKFYDTPLTIERLIELGSITPEAACFLEKLVKSRYNIFISGGTGSGKTTFLNVLSDYIPSDERVITIEDSAELQLHNISNMVRLEARMANAEGENAVSIRDLIKSSLRMRPDRIVVGEVRGAEALDMLQAMNTGHDGSLSTGHGNSPKDMLTRLETMVLMGMSMPVDAIRTQIASAIDIIVHLARQRDKSRKVVQIAEVGNYQNGEIELTPLFKYVEKGETKDGRILGGLVRQSACIKRTEKLEAAGIRLE